MGFAFQKNKYRDKGLPILRVTDIHNNKINSEKLVYFDPSDYPNNIEFALINIGDIFVSWIGTIGKVGWNQTNSSIYLKHGLFALIPNEELLNKRYLFHWLINNQEKINSTLVGVGAIPYLDINKFKKLIISLPSLSEQNSKDIR
ncbi:hypothetical protein A6V39_01625 [Candidatus Mycoplasma haematobovis]|uniref:Type I restriction modification DNA specificity domain-containing protein n=2 Tax=Candidatus Mycoplasma haematobovis TaxID=432608 RepID=A0A1A9QDQ9_9MOLU|nr:hypothetical protein A6V39_01625 [Candidatus Mycoplasma haematobovis]